MPSAMISKQSSDIQRVITLKSSRNKRHRYSEFVIEGHIALDEASKMGWEIKSLFYAKEKKLSR